MAREIEWNDPILKLPCPTPEAFYYNVRLPDPLINQVSKIGGRDLIAAWGYGSAFNGTAKKSSQMDFMLVVGDTLRFHRDNLKHRRSDYECCANAYCQHFLNKLGMNFYGSSIMLPRLSEHGMQLVECEIKYGVIGFNDFLRHARGGRLDSYKTGEGRGHMYLAGRIQKPSLVPVKLPEGGLRSRLDMAVNQARIDGIWLAMGLLPEAFTTEQLMETYTSLSYRADSRIEDPNKIRDIIAQNRAQFGVMFAPLIDQFEQEGILSVDDGMIIKSVSLNRSAVEDWLRRSKQRARIINYIKNPLTFGVKKGLQYSYAKVKRAWIKN